MRLVTMFCGHGGRLVAALAVLGAGGVVAGACQGASRSGAAAATSPSPPPTVATTTTSTLPPTTVFHPTAPQPSQDLAAAHLVAAWKAGDRAAALADATPAAVNATFSQPFPAGGVQARGCSSPVAGPASCVYRVLANGSLLSLTAISLPEGWLVSDARFES